MTDVSLSDIAAVTGNEGFGGTNSWVLIILFALIFGGGGFFGGNAREPYATNSDVQRGFNQQDTSAQLRGIVNGISDATYALNNDIVNESRNLGNTIGAGFATMQQNHCETLRSIDSVKYDNAANTQKILDAITGNRMADMQNQINALQLQSALCGVIRYPNATTYTAGTYAPYYTSGCNCNTNI